MRSFLINIFLFFLFFFFLDRCLIFVRNTTSDKEIDKRLENVLKGEVNDDILILGSSGTARGVDACRIKENMKYSAMNLSYPGSNIDFHEFLLRLILDSKSKPKIILLGMAQTQELIENDILKFRLDRLDPLVKYKSIRDELVKREGKNSILSEILVSYTLKLSQFDLRKKHFSVLDSLDSCGSMLINAKSKNFNKGKHIEYDKSKESLYLKKKLISFAGLCYNNDIKLIILFPPQLHETNNNFTGNIKNILGENVSYFFYKEENNIYRDKTYYFDVQHLNKKGAEIYTDELIIFLKSFL